MGWRLMAWHALSVSAASERTSPGSEESRKSRPISMPEPCSSGSLMVTRCLKSDFVKPSAMQGSQVRLAPRDGDIVGMNRWLAGLAHVSGLDPLAAAPNAFNTTLPIGMTQLIHREQLVVRSFKADLCGMRRAVELPGGEPEMQLLIEVFTAPDCPRCNGVSALANRVAEDLGARARQVNVLDEIDYAVQLGVLMTPAVAINGNLEFVGPPSEKRLRGALARKMDAYG